MAAADILLFLERRGFVEPRYLNAITERFDNRTKDRDTCVLAHLIEDSGSPVAWDAVASCLAEDFQLPMAANDQVPESAVLRFVQPRIAQSCFVVPLRRVGNNLELAIADPFEAARVESLGLAVGMSIDLRLVSFRRIHELLACYYSVQGDNGRSPGTAHQCAVNEDPTPYDKAIRKAIAVQDRTHDADESAQDAPIAEFVHRLIGEAYRRRASDIHLEPLVDRSRVRYRIDGVLTEVRSPPGSLHGAIVSRLKLLSGMSIAERRIPQDGRMRYRSDTIDCDIRTSTVPGIHGESVVLRLLQRDVFLRELGDLGLDPPDHGAMLSLVTAGDGMTLATGPTGCGKTTTLYACLHAINDPDRKLITIEDPIEYTLSGVTQSSVNREAGMSFAIALRAILRQAPNVILIGEIRDVETAQIAVNAALTGHLVLSTLHTNDAAGAIPRLLNIGVKPFLIAAGLRGIIAQRLVRTICEHCRTECAVNARDLAACGVKEVPSESRFACGQGCEDCANSGFLGRTGIFEILPISEGMRHSIHRGASVQSFRKYARESGFRTMREDGIRKALRGITTLSEVASATVDL